MFLPPPKTCAHISAGGDGGLSRGSSLRRPVMRTNKVHIHRSFPCPTKGLFYTLCSNFSQRVVQLGLCQNNGPWVFLEPRISELVRAACMRCPLLAVFFLSFFLSSLPEGVIVGFPNFAWSFKTQKIRFGVNKKVGDPLPPGG